MTSPSVQALQAPLRAQYQLLPQAAWVTDQARTTGPDPGDPFHSRVEPMPGCGAVLPVGMHRAVGGPHDAPTPGDILCAALAACQDTTIRMVANMQGVELEQLTVVVTAEVDVRGCLLMNRQVPVGFQSLLCEVTLRAREGTDPARLAKLQLAAETSCIVLQTLRSPPPVQTKFVMS